MLCPNKTQGRNILWFDPFLTPEYFTNALTYSSVFLMVTKFSEFMVAFEIYSHLKAVHKVRLQLRLILTSNGLRCKGFSVAGALAPREHLY